MVGRQGSARARLVAALNPVPSRAERATAAASKPAPDAVSQRLRVGALGLAGVFLLVMLATALLHAASDADLANHPATANATEPAEPLAQLGVAPGNPAADPATPAPAHPAGQ